MIISCSRRTDIPAFYSEWLCNRLRDGFVLVQNPVNARQIRRVSLLPEEVDGFVFWTKNPAPMFDRLPQLEAYPFYFQFTLTPYNEEIEPHLPPKQELVDGFRRLADRIGPQRVIWRYDPILFSREIGLEYHLEHFGRLAKRLAGFSKTCVISFIDIYRHITSRLGHLAVRAPHEPEMRTLARSIAGLAHDDGMNVQTCAEEIDLAEFGIAHGCCIDARLMSAISGRELRIRKDPHQRKLCGCAVSVDIGQYDTCRYFCKYCYANVSSKKIEKNIALHDEQSPLLTGTISDK